MSHAIIRRAVFGYALVSRAAVDRCRALRLLEGLLFEVGPQFAAAHPCEMLSLSAADDGAINHAPKTPERKERQTNLRAR